MNDEDDLKRGRLDGIDVLSLGSAFGRILSRTQTTTTTVNVSSHSQPWEDWTESCIGNQAQVRQQSFDPATTVQTMLRTAAGQGVPDIVLEGFGETDRWSLRMETVPHPTVGAKHATTTTNRSSSSSLSPLPPPPAPSDDDNGSPDMPTHKLWSTLWGSEPAPATILPALDEIVSDDDDENDNNEPDDDNNTHTNDNRTADCCILDLAAESSIPIDVDEDTFIVSTPEHLDTIHAIVAVPLAAGRLGSAIRILQKILVGLDAAVSTDVPTKAVLRGSTCHNIGLLYLWQGKYTQAADFFAQAVEARLPTTNHDNDDDDCGSQRPCWVNPRTVAVSYVRQGQALFALRQFDDALQYFQKALALTSAQEQVVIRAKVLTNVGVAYYLLGNVSQALESFTQALAIQRKLLDGPVRRELLVLDTSVTLNNMGKLYLECNDHAMAGFIYEEALLLLKTVFRKDHLLVVATLQNLAFAKAQQKGQGPKAIKLLERVRCLQVQIYGSNCAAAVVETCGWMAHLCAREGKLAQAEALYEVVLAWQKVFLPEQHSARQKVEACLKAVATMAHHKPLSWL